jgi:hypothetical protein
LPFSIPPPHTQPPPLPHTAKINETAIDLTMDGGSDSDDELGVDFDDVSADSYVVCDGMGVGWDRFVGLDLLGRLAGWLAGADRSIPAGKKLAREGNN